MHDMSLRLGAASDDAQASGLRYCLLGPVGVFRDGVPLELSRKPRALLALLLINANQVVSTDRIIEELWGSAAGGDPKRSLRVVVSRLRSILEPERERRSEGTTLLTRMPGYLLSVDPEHIDVHRFEALVEQGRACLASDPNTAASLLREGLSLWQAHPLDDFTYEPFAAAEIARLNELRLSAVEDRVEADLRAGRLHGLTSELEALVHQHPFRQRLVGHQMVALHLSGRQGDALRAYQQLRTRLGDELGLDPSAEVAKLEERILLNDPTLRSHAVGQAPGLCARGCELRDRIGGGSLGNGYTTRLPGNRLR